MKNIIITILFLLCCSSASAQLDLVPRAIPSPNTASLGMYGAIPVGHYTGIPDINIPLFEMELDGVKFPLSLSYHASGIRVGQDAGWVGMGWSLNAGGCIANGIRGWSDLDGEVYSRKNLDYVDTDIPGNQMNMKDYESYKEIATNKADGEPDIYYFNFGNYSGSFFTQADFESEDGIAKQIIRRPDCFLDIEWTGDEWVITDGNGFKYYFKTREMITNRSQTYTSHVHSCYSYSATSKTKIRSVPRRYTQAEVTGAWYLDSIVSPNGQKLSFTYALEWIYTPLILQEEIYEPISGYARRKENISYFFSENRQVILKSITGPNLQIDFSGEERYDIEPHVAYPKPSRLAEITISNKQSVIKKYKLNYFYTGTLNDYDNCRLFLDNICEYGADGSIGGKHSFGYDHPEELPSKISTDIDYWGYYNRPDSYMASRCWGQNVVTDKQYSTLIPPYKSDQLVCYGQHRESDPERMCYGTLKWIKYPTGGQTTFEFEPHTIMGGGELPVVPVQEHSSDTSDRSIAIDEQFNGYNFTYTDDFPTGIREGEEFEVTSRRNAIFKVEVEFWIDDPTVLEDFWAKSQYTACIMKYNASKNMYETFRKLDFPPMYDQEHYTDQIEVVLEAGKYKLTAERLYDFSDLQDNLVSFDILASVSCTYLTNRSTFSSKSIGDPQGGGLCVRSIESTDGNGNTIRKEYDYNDGTLMSPVISHKLVSLSESEEVGEGNDSYWVNYSGLYLYAVSGSYVPLSTSASGSYVGYSSVTETIYDNGKMAGNTVYDFYNEYDEIIYTEHFVPGIPTYPNLKNGLLQSKLVYNGDDRLVQEELYDYEFVEGPTANGVKAYLPFTVSTDLVANTEIAMIKWYRLHSFWCKSTSKTISQYDPDGELIASTTEQYTYDPVNYKVKELKTDDSRTGVTYLKTMQYPVNLKNTSSVYARMVKNGQVNPVIEERNSILQGSAQTLLDTRRIDYAFYNNIPRPSALKQNMEKGNSALEERTSITHYDKNGKPNDYVKGSLEKTVYLWGYGSMYPVAKIEGATYAEVENWLGATTINNLTDNTTTVSAVLNTIRSILSGKGVLLTTYTYMPQVGMTSMTTPNGEVTTYEYDALGRLAKVKNHHGKVVELYDYHYKN